VGFENLSTGVKGSGFFEGERKVDHSFDPTASEDAGEGESNIGEPILAS